MPLLPYKGVMPRIGKNVFIAENAYVIGDVELGDNASVWYGAVLRGDFAPIVIGSHTSIQENCVVHTDHGYPSQVGSLCHDRTHRCYSRRVRGRSLHHRHGRSAPEWRDGGIREHCWRGRGARGREGVRAAFSNSGRAGQGAARGFTDQELERIYSNAETYLGYAREYLGSAGTVRRRLTGQ